jgi:hypothetical protein
MPKRQAARRTDAKGRPIGRRATSSNAVRGDLLREFVARHALQFEEGADLFNRRRRAQLAAAELVSAFDDLLAVPRLLPETRCEIDATITQARWCANWLDGGLDNSVPEMVLRLWMAADATDRSGRFRFANAAAAWDAAPEWGQRVVTDDGTVQELPGWAGPGRWRAPTPIETIGAARGAPRGATRRLQKEVATKRKRARR